MDLMYALKAAIIGVVEGLTEFLPISSTAHIVLTERALGFNDPGEVFGVTIQLGAILAVVVYFWRRLWAVASTLHTSTASRRFVLGLMVASIPAAVLGLSLNKWLESHVFGDQVGWIIAVTSTLGGVAIILIERLQLTVRHSDSATLPLRTCLWIGVFQVMAMIPGVSRSGAGILGAMCLGVERKAATEFSFFLAIPIMVGASGLKLVKHRDALHGDLLGALVIGFIVSFAVALLVVHWLLRYVATHRFTPFGWYRIIGGLILAGLLAAGIATDAFTKG